MSRSNQSLDPHALGLYAELLRELRDGLEISADKPEETPENTLRALWCTAAGEPVSATGAEAAELKTLTGPQEQGLRRLIDRRLEGEPLAFLTGRKTFMGTEFCLGRQVFIPRKETELVVTSILELHVSRKIPGKGLVLIDVCTGSANIPLALAAQLDFAAIYATDLLEDALEVARENARRLGHSELLRLFRGDLFAPLAGLAAAGAADLVTCNPPYISSAKVSEMPAEISGHEPPEAFDGGAFGINILQRLIAESPAFLKDGGWLVFEVGAGQGNLIMRRLQRSGSFDEVTGKVDAAGTVRAVLGRKSAKTTGPALS